MRLATFIDPLEGNDARFGIISGNNIVDVVAAQTGCIARCRRHRSRLR